MCLTWSVLSPTDPTEGIRNSTLTLDMYFADTNIMRPPSRRTRTVMFLLFTKPSPKSFTLFPPYTGPSMGLTRSTRGRGWNWKVEGAPTKSSPPCNDTSTTASAGIDKGILRRALPKVACPAARSTELPAPAAPRPKSLLLVTRRGRGGTRLGARGLTPWEMKGNTCSTRACVCVCVCVCLCVFGWKRRYIRPQLPR